MGQRARQAVAAVLPARGADAMFEAITNVLKSIPSPVTPSPERSESCEPIAIGVRR